MSVVWVEYFTPGWRGEAVRTLNARYQAARCVADEIVKQGGSAEAMNPARLRAVRDELSLIEVVVRLHDPAQAAKEAVALVTAAADAIDLIVWQVKAHTDPRSSAPADRGHTRLVGGSRRYAYANPAAETAPATVSGTANRRDRSLVVAVHGPQDRAARRPADAARTPSSRGCTPLGPLSSSATRTKSSGAGSRG